MSASNAPQEGAGRTLDADGIRLELPGGWTGRIVLGAAGRPVLHAADFPVEANDTDEGEVAREAIGSNGMYLNLRDLGAGHASSALPLRFEAADFAQKRDCCGILEASREFETDGELYRITAVSGGGDHPSPAHLGGLNDVLASMQVELYQPPDTRAATGDPIDGYGLHANLPRGWDGGIGRGRVHAGDGSIDVEIEENATAEAASFVTGRAPVHIGPAEFVRPAGGTGYVTGRTFLLAGRSFQLWVRAAELPATTALSKTNAFLASFEADAGDYYRGTVEPAAFQPADGWDTGATGAAAVQPQGQSTATWASTIRYRDAGFQFPPHETLAALPPDGVVLVALLSADVSGADAPDGHTPFALTNFASTGFEGVQSDRDARVLQAHVSGGYDVTLWAFFGREHPTQEQLTTAQAELDRLRLPRWPG